MDRFSAITEKYISWSASSFGGLMYFPQGNFALILGSVNFNWTILLIKLVSVKKMENIFTDQNYFPVFDFVALS